MKLSRFGLQSLLSLVPFILILSLPAGAQEQPRVDSYRLGAGDKIAINVFDESELSLEVVISDLGTVSYPFLGELRVKGITPAALERRITAGLKDGYMIDPKVTVTVVEYRPFFIHGEVELSGGYPYQPGLTLRKAVTLAGGLTERASKSKISVIREGDPQQASIRITMDDLIYPGDTITVEQSFF